MCSNPLTFEGQKVSCRNCDHCIATKKNEWVARAMAELAVGNEAVAVTLTYRNSPEGSPPVGARVFRYADVQRFVKLLREQYFRHYGERGQIRYLVAGERGSKKGRVHWHMVIFAAKPLDVLGRFSSPSDPHLEALVYEKRIDWTTWPHGFVYFQKPDQGGFEYLLKYALKDRYNSEKSKGTGRFMKSEDNAASMFRMSKNPAIGKPFLEAKVAEWDARGVLPVSLNIKVPNYSGYWWPGGDLRRWLLECLRAITDKVIAERGRPPPQYTALLGSLEGYESDDDVLRYPTEEDNQDGQEEREIEAFKRELALRRRPERDYRLDDAFAALRACGGYDVCEPCYQANAEQFDRWLTQQIDEYRRSGTRQKFADWYAQRPVGFNPFCRSANEPHYQAFLARCSGKFG